MSKFTWVTSNKGKLREIIAILGVDLNNQAIDLPELQLGTSEEVAYYKVKEAAKIIGGPVLIDDTALHFNALHGLPGAYIRAFTDKLTPLEMSKMLDGFEDKSAYVTCSIGYCAGPGQEPVVFTGRVDGKIVPPRGNGGFGFDPIFQPNGVDQTYAELPEEKKNSLSHRYLALMKLKESGILK
ncbi:nucleoside triphosphate pyrophosphohydrolase ham1 [Tritrichomonas musculus]|uniref:Nucleoside triphosphate pyrophosphohydrolase ham1 n=1 Tax=Tritrichomonas musculus TaxID=1915356 RepID=A0ABR2IPN5_9EUKA